MWSLAREGEHSLLSCQGTATLAARWAPTALSEPGVWCFLRTGIPAPAWGGALQCMLGRG